MTKPKVYGFVLFLLACWLYADEDTLAPSFSTVPIGMKERLQLPVAHLSKGELVLLHFWSPSNKKSVDGLQQIRWVHKEYKDRGLDIVGVASDASEDDVKQWIGSIPMPWVHVLDKEWIASTSSNSLVAEKTLRSIRKSYGVSSLPSAFLIDRQSGGILTKGESLQGDQLRKTIERFLRGWEVIKVKDGAFVKSDKDGGFRIRFNRSGQVLGYRFASSEQAFEWMTRKDAEEKAERDAEKSAEIVK